MLYFDKRIRYLHFYENGVKLQSAGYVNFQVRDSRCQMNLFVRGPRLMGSGTAKIFLEYGCRFDDFPHIWKEENEKCKRVLLDEMVIRNGQGSYFNRLDSLHMDGMSLRYDQVCGIYIELSKDQVLSSRWTMDHVMPKELIGSSDNKLQKVEEHHPMMEEPQIMKEEPYLMMEEPQFMKEEPHPMMEEPQPMIEEPQPMIKEPQPMMEEPASYENPLEKEEMEATAIREKEKGEWKALVEKFPVVHPLGEQEYLKLDLSDLTLFQDPEQKLAQNSFLLHGYYNYKHLILGRQEKEGSTLYYIGVPGIFHEREKAVAIMFGFEAFEGNREPIQKGDFGYYFKKVSLQNQRGE